MAHRDLHPEYVEGCFGCKTLSVSVSATALENRGEGVRREDSREAQLAKDLKAYKNLRDNGLHPKKIDGAHDLEHSDIKGQFDIDLGHIVPKEKESLVREGFEACREMGLME